MKRLIMLLAVVFVFTITSMAQTSTSSSSGQSDQTSATTSKSKSKKSSSSDMGGAAASETGKAKKNSTLTGCLNSDATMLTNGRYKNGVKVGPADKVKDHAGHQVALTGSWSGTGADKSFDVASVKHISETCSAVKGGGTTGITKKGAKSKDSAAPPKS